MKTHDLKCFPKFFGALWAGVKTFEVRRNDRDYKVGDELQLREWSLVDGYSGREIRFRVDYMLDDPAFGVAPGFVILGLGTGEDPRAKPDGKVETFIWCYPGTGTNGAALDSLVVSVNAGRSIPDIILRFDAERESWIAGGLFKTPDGNLRFLELASLHRGEFDEDRLLMQEGRG